jgi:predicted RNA methylase
MHRPITWEGAPNDRHPAPRVLEPSAGEGHLVRTILEVMPSALLVALEPNSERAHTMGANVGRRAAIMGSTVEAYLTALDDRQPHFDAVIMNPPYALPGRARAWAEHVLQLWNHNGVLQPGGVLVAVVPNSITSGRDRTTAAVRGLVETHGGYVPVAEDAFRSVGTGVRTTIFWLVKPSE